VDDESGEGVARPERVDEQDQQRAQVGDDQPADGACQQQPEAGAGGGAVFEAVASATGP